MAKKHKRPKLNNIQKVKDIKYQSKFFQSGLGEQLIKDLQNGKE